VSIPDRKAHYFVRL